MTVDRRRLLALSCALPLALATRTVRAQPATPFPQRDVHLIVPSSAGSSTDTLARELAAQLQAQWRPSVVVDNVTGASSQLATQRLLRAPADGHHVQLTNTALFTNAALLPSVPYDTLTELRGVASLVMLPSYLVVRVDTGFQTLGDLLAASRAAPGKLNYGSSGLRTGPHIGMALLADLAQVEWLHVPYRGAQEAAVDLLGGRLQMAMLPRGMAISTVSTGKARLLAVTEPVPWPEGRGLAVLSTLYRDYRYRGVFGAVVQAGVPQAVVDQLNAALRGAVAALDANGKLAELGFTAAVGTPAEFQAVIAEQIGLWRRWKLRIQLD